MRGLDGSRTCSIWADIGCIIALDLFAGRLVQAVAARMTAALHHAQAPHRCCADIRLGRGGGRPAQLPTRVVDLRRGAQAFPSSFDSADAQCLEAETEEAISRSSASKWRRGAKDRRCTAYLTK